MPKENTMTKTLRSAWLILLFLFLFVSFTTGSIFALPIPTPEVTTMPATAVTTSSATLHGEVDPQRQNTNVIFRWGTSYDYTNSGPYNPPIQISDPQTVSHPISDLAGNTVYHFRVEATPIDGATVVGDDMTFFTGTPSPPTATTTAASSVTSSGATLNGTVNSGGGSATVTFEYGLSTSYGSTVTAQQSPLTSISNEAVSAVLGELTGNTTYHYRVNAETPQGTSTGSDMTFTTGFSLPSAITVLPSSVSSTGATLNGLINANGKPASVVFRWGPHEDYTDSNYDTPIAVTGSEWTPVSLPVAGLTANTLYHFMVEAFYPSDIYAFASGEDMTIFTGTPSAPTATTETASPVTSSGATLYGTVNSGGGSAAVTFEYGTTTSYGSTVLADQNPVASTTDKAVSATLNDLAGGTTYHYRTMAVTTQGTAYGADKTFTTLFAPPFVTTDEATSVSNNSAILNGTVNAFGNTTTVTFEYGPDTSYGTTVTADQSTVSGSDYAPMSTTLSGLSTGTTYHYRVVGTNSDGIFNGNDQTFKTSINGPLAITKEASAIQLNSLVLNGIVNANNFPTTVTFQYGTSTSYSRAIPATPSIVSGNVNTPVTLNLSNLDYNKTFYFRVIAENSEGKSEGSNLSFTTPASAPVVSTQPASLITETGATVNGIVNALGSSSTVTIEYGPTTSYGTTETADQSPVGGRSDTVISKTLDGLSPSTTYHYRVIAENSGGVSTGSDVSFTTLVVPPTASTETASDITSTAARLNGTVNAIGSSTTVTFEYGLTTSYGTTVTADQNPVTGSSDTAVSILLSGLLPETMYHYRVIAENSEGTSYGDDSSFTTTKGFPWTLFLKGILREN